ncbi:MAG: hypothetical protein GYA24_20955 [Candidatus Lokiarchaeota archaeon]|nr:hypothetical protein [Candidatus Lokiarchaeota archaeon]
MATNPVPDIKDMTFRPLPKTLLESMLKRTLEYDCTDHVLANEAWQVIAGAELDYRKVMRDAARSFMDDAWYLISVEPANSGVPVLVFQKERVNMLLAGAIAGSQSMVVILITAASKQDLAFAGKSIERIVRKIAK